MMRKFVRGGRIAAWSAAGVLGAATVAGVVASGAGAAAASSAGSSVTARDTAATPPPVKRTIPGSGGPFRPPAAFRAGMIGPGIFMGPAGALAGPPGGLGTPLYGTWTFSRGGTDHTYRMQVGTLTATGGSAFTVTSSDHTTYSYTTDASTKLVKNGKASTLAALTGATVQVLAQQSGGGYVARAVVSGVPPQVTVRVDAGVLQVAADGESVTVNGQKFLVDSSTRVIRNGKPATLAQLKGTKVKVVGVKNSSGALVARAVISGPLPGAGPRPRPFPVWIGSNAAPKPAPSASA